MTKLKFSVKLERASARVRIKELLKAIETTAARDQPTSTWPVIRHTGLTLTGRHAHSYPALQPLNAKNVITTKTFFLFNSTEAVLPCVKYWPGVALFEFQWT